jgi:hypothetical protein
MTPVPALDSIDGVIQALAGAGYQAHRRLATAVFLSLRLQRPLLLEGEPGVGKTELAKVLATIRNSELIRLQCYEGIDADFCRAVAAALLGDPEKVDAAMMMLGDACDDFEKDYALRIQTVLASRAAAVEVVC